MQQSVPQHVTMQQSLPQQRAPMSQSMPANLEKVKGIEVLFFDHVELTKSHFGSNRFVDVGTLSVVYFPEYKRFVLYLGDWEYALLKRLPIVASSRTDMKSRFYTFPTYHGFYTCKINKIAYPESLQNFETILANFSKFSYKGEETPVRQNETSPDVSLVDIPIEEAEPISEARSYSRKTPNASFVEDSNPGKLKGSDRFKRGFAKLADKLSVHKHKETNLFVTQIHTIESMVTPNQPFAPIELFGRRDVESVINKSKDVANKMHFGASPNQVQIIDTRDMFESLRLVEYNGELMTETEIEIMKQIEIERGAQVLERKQQEEHRQLEQFYIQKERELREAIRRQQDQVRVEQMAYTEQQYQVEIDKRDEQVVAQAMIRDAEQRAFEQREQALLAEIEARLAELRAKEIMTEEERVEFARREQELLEINSRREAARAEAEMMEKSLIKKIEKAEIDFKERERMTETERARLREQQRLLEEEVRARLADLLAKEKLTEKERIELQEREAYLARILELKEGERIQIGREQETLILNNAQLMAELREREMMTQAERLALEARERFIEQEAKKILAELRAKEALTEAERAELEIREKEIVRFAALREAERVDIVKRQKDLFAEAERREMALRERERLTESERAELERIAIELRRETELKMIERQELEAKRLELLASAEQRYAEIERRELLTATERLDLERREEELRIELEAELAMLRAKEALTESERLELQKREQELFKLKQIKEVEIRTRSGQLDKLKDHEARLLAQNAELIKGHKEMHHEIHEIKKELENPVVETTTTTTTITQESQVLQDTA